MKNYFFYLFFRKMRHLWRDARILKCILQNSLAEKFTCNFFIFYNIPLNY